MSSSKCHPIVHLVSPKFDVAILNHRCCSPGVNDHLKKKNPLNYEQDLNP
jgi:hypothetical protein